MFETHKDNSKAGKNEVNEIFYEWIYELFEKWINTAKVLGKDEVNKSFIQ